MKKKLFTLLAFFSLAQISVLPVFAEGMLPKNWDTKIQESADFAYPKNGNGLEMLQQLVIDNIGQIFRYILISVAILYIFIDLLILILGGSDAVDGVKTNLSHYVLGLLLVGFVQEAVKIFDTAYLDGQIGNVAQAKTVMQYIINYISLFSGVIAVFFMLISATRMITAQGDDGIISEEKKDFQYGFLGLVVIIMADVIINKVFYPSDIQAPAEQETLTFAQELFSMAHYFLQFMAITAIAFLVLAGGYYVMSFQSEGDIDKAKTILKNVAIGFIMIAFAYTLVSAVSPNIMGQVVAQ